MFCAITPRAVDVAQRDEDAVVAKFASEGVRVELRARAGADDGEAAARRHLAGDEMRARTLSEDTLVENQEISV